VNINSANRFANRSFQQNPLKVQSAWNAKYGDLFVQKPSASGDFVSKFLLAGDKLSTKSFALNPTTGKPQISCTKKQKQKSTPLQPRIAVYVMWYFYYHCYYYHLSLFLSLCHFCHYATVAENHTALCVDVLKAEEAKGKWASGDRTVVVSTDVRAKMCTESRTESVIWGWWAGMQCTDVSRCTTAADETPRDWTVSQQLLSVVL